MWRVLKAIKFLFLVVGAGKSAQCAGKAVKLSTLSVMLWY